MKMLLSTGVLRDIEAVMYLSNKMNLDGIELMCSHVKDINFVKKLQKKYKQKIFNVHVSLFSDRLVNYLIKPITTAKNIIRESVAVAKIFGANNIVVHPFLSFFSKNQMEKKMYKILNRYKSQRITFSIENMEIINKFGLRIEPWCLSDYEKLYKFSIKTGVKITLDTSHCMSKGIDPSVFFEKYKDKINNIHLSNYKNGRTHLPLYDGIINFKNFFHLIKKSKYNGCLTLETNSKNKAEVIRNINFILYTCKIKFKSQS